MKKRVNITVDKELHEWATKHFGEREFSKAVSDQLICISSSIEAARKIVDEEVKVKINFSKEMSHEEDKMAKDKSIQFDFELAQKLADSLEEQKVEQLKSVDLSEEDLKTQALKEFETSIELYQKYENTEEGYPLNFDKKTEDTIKRLALVDKLKTQDLVRRKIQSYLAVAMKSKFDEMLEEMTDIVVNLQNETQKRNIRQFELELALASFGEASKVSK